MIKIGYKHDICGEEYYIGDKIDLSDGEHYIDECTSFIIKNKTVSIIYIHKHYEYTRIVVKDDSDFWELRLNDILRYSAYLHGGHFGEYKEAAHNYPKLNSYRDEIISRLIRYNDCIKVV